MTLFPDFVPNRIGGVEPPRGTTAVIDVVNPHDASILAAVPRSGAGEIDTAVAAARMAQPGWAATPGVQRGEVLHRIANLIEARKDDLARIVALEAGKRLPDAQGEAAAAIQCARFFAGEGQRLFGRTTTSGMALRWAMTVRRPCGVAGLIIAANTPAPNFAWKVFPALICGNGVVLKTAEDTPVSSWFLARLCEEAGLPTGVLNVVHGLGAEAGQALVEHPDVDVLSFTGSTRVGRMIAEVAGRQLKKVSLELGGKNPLVVCDDADLDNAVRWATLAAFSNAGQRCAAASRIIVFDSVYDAFVAKLVAAVDGLKLGVEPDCDLGPVINARQLANMLAAIERAKAEGAEIVCGGRRAASPDLAAGFYLQPTVVAGVAPDAEMSRTELFGPITTLYRVADFEAAVALANNTPYGLTAAIHTRDVDRALTFASRVRSGVATLNGGTHGSEPHMPFGGVKASGNGTREPGTEALDVYSELQDVYLNVRLPL
ncbi:aldehyde dehydrogenase family protein [Blastochloris viridis]|uniref:Aldehyde dehydrogenase B n=1 Tax=Blastochloris viridis TaxID=1079 RepID=A0A0H5BDS9_BLAVI|nr:aldehyde dehydrogenase family protein [Blastochloris viridis]ALK09738.1 Aldehyde dehydrogenase, thermostable [Blastochloris viridis]BAS00368.1 aldehyde dehydrogenase B [Blastochloris viridis]CUU42401.1 Aldehyde dehydrogenase, thermostable [Blastochloris viridis]